MIFVALSEAADANELLLVDGGLCRFHKRRDGAVTIRELLVLPSHRRKGIGRRLVIEVCNRNPRAVIQATCPGEYEANKFWEAMGFAIAAYKQPDGRMVLWQYRT